MRLFVAVQPAENFLNSLCLLQERLRRAGVGGHYIDEPNLHMTLAFIGEWPENISEILPAVKKPFPIVLSQLAVFLGSDVLCALTEPSEALDNTARAVRHALADAGIPFDPTTKEKVDISLSAAERQVGGLGILLVRELMDSINYERKDEQNVLTLTKKIKL